jgi:cytochrome c biogenesis protein CcmG, thiol:disulfide interchange protein DsbE
MVRPLHTVPGIFWLCIGIMLGLGLLMQRPYVPPASQLIGTPLPAIDLPMLGNEKTRFTSALGKNKPAMISVFASWCMPCSMEHPVLMELAKTGKIDIYGIAWKDSESNVKAWLEKRGNPYKAVGIDEHRTTTIPLALTGVPETFIVDKNGIIVLNYKSYLTDEAIKKTILPVLEKLQHE